MNLVLLPRSHEDETRLVLVVAQALGRRFVGGEHRAGRLRITGCVERKLEEAPLARLRRGEDADDVAVAERRAFGQALRRAAAAPQEGAVDATAVDDEPDSPLALERAVAGARDEELGIGLERDVVHIRQTPHRRAGSSEYDGQG